jgi:signal transduction histidine kinase/CheY-like chemotaxis protein
MGGAMSVPSQFVGNLTPPRVSSAKPKPRSIERRFRLMQSGTLALAVLLFSTALCLGVAYQKRLAASIQALHVEGVQAQRLERLNAEMRASSRQMLALLIAFAGFSVAVAAWFRRAHQRYIWQHLDELGQLVAEVRRGNLKLTPEVPDTVEFGPLMEAFQGMAAELAEMRTSLEQKVVERTAKLEVAQKELLQAAKLASLGQLVSGVAHEINNPLTSILGFSEVVLGRRGIDAAVLAPIRTIREEALRLKNVVANLSSFARHAPHRTQRLDLRTIIDRLIDLRDYHLRADNVTLHVSKPADPLWVTADPDQLLQVLLNLLLNSEHAIHEARDRGDIWIECGTGAGVAYFTVRDNGAGMSTETREHIFEPFFTTKQPGQGTGLGLAISHGIVQQHDGRILVESKIGEGTSIRVELPVSVDKPSATSSSNGRSKASASLSIMRHALVIDDEPGILEMVGDTLERMGCRVTLLQGSSGVDAALQNNQFDVVLCDLKMPGQNGLDVYRRLRSDCPELAARFLLMTGNLADAEDHAAELASVPILPKPFTLARLREAVKQLLAKPLDF